MNHSDTCSVKFLPGSPGAWRGHGKYALVARASDNNIQAECLHEVCAGAEVGGYASLRTDKGERMRQGRSLTYVKQVLTGLRSVEVPTGRKVRQRRTHEGITLSLIPGATIATGGSMEIQGDVLIHI